MLLYIYERQKCFRLIWGDGYMPVRDQSKSETSPLLPDKKRTFSFLLLRSKKLFSFDSKDIVLENQS